MNNTRQKRRTSGFTIVEITIVVIIIGVLASLALPSYRIQMLKMRNQEGIRILMALWEGQKDFFRENNVYTNNILDLDIDIPASKYFQDPVVISTSFACVGLPQLYVAHIDPAGDPYRLYALADGRVVCSPIGAGICPGSLCIKMGFENW